MYSDREKLTRKRMCIRVQFYPIQGNASTSAKNEVASYISTNISLKGSISIWSELNDTERVASKKRYGIKMATDSQEAEWA